MKEKFLFAMLALIGAALLSVGFTSCSSDDDEEEGNGGNGNLIGWWMTTPYEGWEGYEFCKALHFIDGSVVDYYEYVANG